MATCDPSTLAQNASCIDCGVPKGMRDAIMIWLLCQIQAGGGAGGGGNVQGFVANYAGGVPTAVPTAVLAFAVDTSSNNELWVWFNAAWHDSGIALP